VPQVLAAGWSGTGIAYCILPSPPPIERWVPSRGAYDAEFASFDLGDACELSRRAPAAGDLVALAAALNARYTDTGSVELDITQIAELVELGLDPQLAEWLLGVVDAQASERQVVIAFLMGLLDEPIGSLLSRHMQRLIRRARRELKLEHRLHEVIRTRSFGLTA